MGSCHEFRGGSHFGPLPFPCILGFRNQGLGLGLGFIGFGCWVRGLVLGLKFSCLGLDFSSISDVQVVMVRVTLHHLKEELCEKFIREWKREWELLCCLRLV